MERAAKLIKGNKYARRLVDDEDVARGLWPAAVGKTIARHTSKITLVRDTLVVEVEDRVWQRQLFSLSCQIVARIQNLMGSTCVQNVEFRVEPLRRQMQRAETPRTRAFDPNDEAEGIEDVVLKKLYRISRKRATA